MQRFTCRCCESSPVIKKRLNNETFEIHHRGTQAQSEETQLKRLHLNSAQTAARTSGQLTLSVFLVTMAAQLEKMMRCSADSVENLCDCFGSCWISAPLPGLGLGTPVVAIPQLSVNAAHSQ